MSLGGKSLDIHSVYSICQQMDDMTLLNFTRTNKINKDLCGILIEKRLLETRDANFILAYGDLSYIDPFIRRITDELLAYEAKYLDLVSQKNSLKRLPYWDLSDRDAKRLKKENKAKIEILDKEIREIDHIIDDFWISLEDLIYGLLSVNKGEALRCLGTLHEIIPDYEFMEPTLDVRLLLRLVKEHRYDDAIMLIRDIPLDDEEALEVPPEVLSRVSPNNELIITYNQILRRKKFSGKNNNDSYVLKYATLDQLKDIAMSGGVPGHLQLRVLLRFAEAENLSGITMDMIKTMIRNE